MADWAPEGARRWPTWRRRAPVDGRLGARGGARAPRFRASRDESRDVNSSDEILQNSPDKLEGYFAVPKVVE